MLPVVTIESVSNLQTVGAAHVSQTVCQSPQQDAVRIHGKDRPL